MVSIVAPALNCAGEVDGFAKSVRQLDYPADRFEIIVADNGSSDDTVVRLEANGIRCVVRHERGRSRALNAGLRAARGELICTTDISCRPRADWLSRVVECFEDPSIGCVAGDIRLLPTHWNLALRFQARNDYMSPMHAASRKSLPFLPYADGANASFRREVFEQIGPFNETFYKGADVEICYRMLVATRYKIAFCRQAVVEESGEPTLRALLKQRFRIGMAVNLLQARFPDFYRPAPRRGGLVRTVYWTAASLAYNFAKRVQTVRPPSKDELEDVAIRVLMSWAQTLGLHYGAWHLKRSDARPDPVDAASMRDFIARMTLLQDRVLVR